MMTEKEARGKECPMTFAGTYDFPCKGSDCMAWRWVDGPTDDVDGDTRLDAVSSKATGFCGLAGRPE